MTTTMSRLDDVDLLRCTYRRTGSGEWVVCGPTSAVRAGEKVTVYRKDNTTREETVARVGRPFRVKVAGGVMMEVVYGYLAPREHTGGRRPAARPCTCGLHRAYRPCQTDGQCSSFGDGRTCGGCDCDGF